jgi:hypothetical protein
MSILRDFLDVDMWQLPSGTSVVCCHSILVVSYQLTDSMIILAFYLVDIYQTTSEGYKRKTVVVQHNYAIYSYTNV